jgi:hypothetical protein
MIKKLLCKTANLNSILHNLQFDNSALMTDSFMIYNWMSPIAKSDVSVINHFFKTIIKEVSYLLATDSFPQKIVISKFK